MDAETRSGLIHETRLVAVAVVPVIAASFTYPNLAPWHAGLVKPAFNPPNWVFAPVWTTLYVLMAFAVWRVLRLRRKTPTRRLGLTLFFTQLALNATWPWMFLGAHSPALGLVNIVPQLLVILATVIVFWWLDRIAGGCLAPLAVWVAFATILNFAIWSLKHLTDKRFALVGSSSRLVT